MKAKPKSIIEAIKGVEEKPRELFFNNFLLLNTETHQEFRLVADRLSKNQLRFYIHPLGKDGTTFDGYATMNVFSVQERFSLDKLINALKNVELPKRIREIKPKRRVKK